MSSMIFSKNDHLILKELANRKIRQSNIELEAVIKRDISTEKFKYLAKCLDSIYISESHNSKIQNPDILDIFLYTTDKRKDSSIRYTLTGIDNIRNYCKVDNSEHFTKIYKTNVQWTALELQKLNRDLPPNYYRNDIMVLYMNDHDNLRFNSKLEIEFDEKSNSFKDIDADQKYQNLQTFIQSVGWENVMKTFRFKKRTSYITGDGFRIDLTVVKSSKKKISSNGREELFQHKLFRESNCLNEQENFEVEIEYIGNSLNVDEICIGFSNHCKYIISKLFFRNNTIITSSERRIVLDEYKKCVLNMVDDSVSVNINKIKDIVKELSKPVEQQNLDKYNENYSVYKDHRERIHNLISKKGDFKEQTILTSLENTQRKIQTQTGSYNFNQNEKNKFFYIPKVVSMNVENIHESYPRNIINGFTVTDKADGETMILFISEKENNAVYMIDSNLEVNKIDAQLRGNIGGTIIAGEYIETNSEFWIFDAYYYKKNDIRFLPLINKDADGIILDETRIGKVYNIVPNIRITQGDFGIHIKNFLYGDDIFKLSNEIWKNNHLFPYKLDGLIYTPQFEPVGYDSTRFDYYTQLRTAWYRNLKWKPAEENTIDFLVKFEKERIIINKEQNLFIERDKIKYMSAINGSKSEFKAYKTVELWCGFKSSIIRNPCTDNSNLPSSTYIEKYIDTRFTPTNPYNELAYIANIPCEDINNSIYGLHDRGKIMDNTIVEFRYNLLKKCHTKEDEFFRWEPLRTRHEKTNEYIIARKNKQRIFKIFKKYMDLKHDVSYNQWSKMEQEELSELEIICSKYRLTQIGYSKDTKSWIYKTLKNIKNKEIVSSIENEMDIPISISFGNDFKVANDIWSSMYNPITTEMISTGNNIPKITDKESLYYTREVSRDKSATLNMQIFHNKIIKNIELIGKACNIIRKDLSQDTPISLLDLATGRGGDLYKWRDNKINKVVGIDLVDSNIYDTKDGACIRYTEFKKNMEAFKVDFVPDVSFLQGDITKNILDGSAMLSEHSKELYDLLWNDPSNSQYSFTKFNIISMQFAIHYTFKNDTMLNNLLTNIRENLKPGGLFIGCCFDGNIVYNKLKDKPFDGYIDGFSQEHLIWRIRKKYDNLKVPDNLDTVNSIGMPIDVYLHSIGKTVTEYLVNYEFLKRKLAEIYLVPVESHLFIEIYNKYKDHPEFSDLLSNIDKNSSEKEFSGMNRLFIFQKQSDIVVQVDELYRQILMHKSNSKFNNALLEGKSKNNWEKIIGVVQELNGKEISADLSKQLVDKLKKEISEKKLVIDTKSKSKSALVSSVVTSSKDEPGGKAVSAVALNALDTSKSEMQSVAQDESIAQAIIDKKKSTFVRNYNKFKPIIEDPTFPKKLQKTQIQTAHDGLTKLREQYMLQFNTEPELKAAIDKIDESISKLQKELNK
jgi:hypothetical protein